MQASLEKLRPGEEQTQKIVTGNIYEYVEICGHLFGKSVRYKLLVSRNFQIRRRQQRKSAPNFFVQDSRTLMGFTPFLSI